MCHGSKKIKAARNHITYVEASETIIVKNWVLLNILPMVKSFSATSAWIDFTVTKTAAKAR
jgi:hypothetical protein